MNKYQRFIKAYGEIENADPRNTDESNKAIDNVLDIARAFESCGYDGYWVIAAMIYALSNRRFRIDTNRMSHFHIYADRFSSLYTGHDAPIDYRAAQACIEYLNELKAIEDADEFNTRVMLDKLTFVGAA